jgi:hypothetical protein
MCRCANIGMVFAACNIYIIYFIYFCQADVCENGMYPMKACQENQTTFCREQLMKNPERNRIH